MRTFVAVRPPAAALEHLAAALPHRPSGSDRWHVTLAFLGEVDDPRRLVAPLGEVAQGSAPFALRLVGSGTFGRHGPVWVGVGGDVAALTALATGVARACRRAGVDVERRPYRPHLTVGRRGRPDPRPLASYAGPAWSVDELELVVSHLRPVVRHEVMARLPLTA